MIILRQKEYGLVSGLGNAAAKAAKWSGHAIYGAGTLAGAGVHAVGDVMSAHPVGAGLLAAYGLYKLIKRRKARRAGQTY